MAICYFEPGAVAFIVNLALLGLGLGAMGITVLVHAWWRDRCRSR